VAERRTYPADAETWIDAYVDRAGPIQTVHQRPWATVLRVPLRKGTAWFKACEPLQAFEPRLTAELFARWPDRVPEVIAHDLSLFYLLLADAGTPMAALGNPPELWLSLLPRYAELQRAEAQYVDRHLQSGVPDLRVATWPNRYQELLSADLPVGQDEMRRLRRLAGPFERWCAELAGAGIPETIQHDDLHMNNVYVRDDASRILDWGDSCLSHPFASVVATFRFLEERNGLPSDDPWFQRLGDAYLEPWGSGLGETLALAIKVGAFAHAFAALRQRRALLAPARAHFDVDLAARLRRALTQAER
jgi:hypothetical protein